MWEWRRTKPGILHTKSATDDYPERGAGQQVSPILPATNVDIIKFPCEWESIRRVQCASSTTCQPYCATLDRGGRGWNWYSFSLLLSLNTGSSERFFFVGCRKSGLLFACGRWWAYSCAPLQFIAISPPMRQCILYHDEQRWCGICCLLHFIRPCVAVRRCLLGLMKSRYSSSTTTTQEVLKYAEVE